MRTSLVCAFALLGIAALALSASGGILSFEPNGPASTFAGNVRAYAVTTNGDYARQNFQTMFTLTIKGGGGDGCAFIGLGKGAPDAGNFKEPSTSPSLYLRLCPSDFAGGLVSAIANGRKAGRASANVGDGKHRIRLTWDAAGKRALFEVAKNWDGEHFHADSELTVDASSIAFHADARLFVGGGNGDRFSDFSIKTLTAQELKAAGFGENFLNDPKAKTWLPAGGAPAPKLAPELADLLKPLSASMRPLACWYGRSTLIASRTFADGVARTPGSSWTAQTQSAPLADDKDGLDLTRTFKLADGQASSAGVAAAFDFANWDTSNYVLIPASVYNGNRNRIVARGYSQGLDPQDAWEARLPLLATEAEGPAGKLAQTQAGLTVSRPGVLATAFGANPDGSGTLLRVWDQTGATGQLVVTIPGQFKSATPVNLRGEEAGQPIPIEAGKLTFALPAYAPASFVLE